MPQQRSNLRPASASFTSESIRLMLAMVEHRAEAAPVELVDTIAAQLERELADVPATIRGNLECDNQSYERWFLSAPSVDLQPFQQEFLRVIGVDLGSGPSITVDVTYGLQGEIIAIDEYPEVEESDENGFDTLSPDAANDQPPVSHQAVPFGIAKGVQGVRTDSPSCPEPGRDCEGRRPSLESGAKRAKNGESLAAEAAPERKATAPVAATRDWYVHRQETLDAAVRFLKARCILVDVVDRASPVRRYRVSGKRDAMYLEGVVELAQRLGFEALS